MTTYYRVDGAKLSYAEYWRLSPSAIPFAVAAGLKLIGFPLRFKFAIPRPDRLFLVEFEELPDIARRALEPELDSAESAGFRLLFCHRLALPEPDRLGAACLLLDERNLCGLMVMFGKHGDQRELPSRLDSPNSFRRSPSGWLVYSVASDHPGSAGASPSQYGRSLPELQE